MRQRLCPLELSAIMTFAVLAILTLTTGMAWKEHARLVADNEWLHRQLSLPVHVATSEDVERDCNS